MAYILESSLDGIHKFIAVTNASVIGCSMMVNDQGLAGSADYPAHLTRKGDPSALLPESADPQYRGMMAGSMLRYIAERASTCRQALEIIEDFVTKGYYAGGDVNGNHWLLVDREGTILEVSNNASHVASKFHTQKVYFSRFDNSPAAQDCGANAPIGFSLFHGVARDPSICLKSSISGMTVEIDPAHPELLTCAWISLPVRSGSFPVLMGQTKTPTCLLNGEAYRLGKQSKGNPQSWEALEQAAHASKEGLKERVLANVANRVGDLRSAVSAGSRPAPSTMRQGAQANLLQRWSREQSGMLVERLQALRRHRRRSSSLSQNSLEKKYNENVGGSLHPAAGGDGRRRSEGLGEHHPLRIAYVYDSGRNAAATRRDRNTGTSTFAKFSTSWACGRRRCHRRCCGTLSGSRGAPRFSSGTWPRRPPRRGPRQSRSVDPRRRTLIAFSTDGLDDLCGNRRLGHASSRRRLHVRSRLRPDPSSAHARDPLAAAAHPALAHLLRRAATAAGAVHRLHRLYDPRGADTGCAAVTARQLGKGPPFYFAFSVPQTMWVLHQGRPVDRDYDGDKRLRRSDAIVIRPHSSEVAYADELLLLVQNMIAVEPHPFLHQLPPVSPPPAGGGGRNEAGSRRGFLLGRGRRGQHGGHPTGRLELDE